MNPLRVSVTNYRSFERLDLELPTGCVAIVGENGAGKSSIVNVVDLCLFGPPSRTLADYLTEGCEEPMILELEFEHRGELYRVRRTYSPKGRGQTKVDFEQAPHGPALPVLWVPLTRETAAATQALIEETIGLSRETFRASAFLAQGDGAAFTEAQPRERKAILAEVLGLEIWDRLLVLAKNERTRLEAQLDSANMRIGSAQEDLEREPQLRTEKTELDQRAEELAGRVAEGEREAKAAQEKLTRAREGAAERNGAEAALAAREADTARVRNRIDAITQELDGAALLGREHLAAGTLAEKVPALEHELTATRAEAEKRRERERLVLERNRLLGEASGFNETAHAIREEAKLLEENGPGATTCDRCGQTLGAEALAATLANMRAEATALDRQAAQKDIEASRVPIEFLSEMEPATATRLVDEIENELRVARNAEKVVAELSARLDRMAELKRERTSLEVELPKLAHGRDEAAQVVAALSETPPLGELEHALVTAEDLLRSARALLAETDRRRAQVETQLERIDELAKTVGQWSRLAADTDAELEVVLLAERAYGRDGIPTLIVENAAIPQIELEANRILAELGTSFTVELRTQRELKGGGLAEALDIVVAGPGGERPYETFSGGERTRLNLSLRIALARLLAHRRGAEVRMLVIDEPEFLDEAGVARLAEVLRGLSADFERTFLISHQPALRDAFDEVLTIEKDGDRSRVMEFTESPGFMESKEVAA